MRRTLAFANLGDSPTAGHSAPRVASASGGLGGSLEYDSGTGASNSSSPGRSSPTSVLPLARPTCDKGGISYTYFDKHTGTLVTAVAPAQPALSPQLPAPRSPPRARLKDSDDELDGPDRSFLAAPREPAPSGVACAAAAVAAPSISSAAPVKRRKAGPGCKPAKGGNLVALLLTTVLGTCAAVHLGPGRITGAITAAARAAGPPVGMASRAIAAAAVSTSAAAAGAAVAASRSLAEMRKARPTAGEPFPAAMTEWQPRRRASPPLSEAPESQNDFAVRREVRWAPHVSMGRG